MNYNQAKKQCIEEMLNRYNCRTIKELCEIIGITTIRCYWVDFVDYLIKNREVNEKIAIKWGQIV